jgi:hypothetical protein
VNAISGRRAGGARRQWSARVAVLGVLLAAASGLGFDAGPSRAASTWTQWLHLPGVVDVAGPRHDGRLVAAARGRLVLVSSAGRVTPFAPAYSVPEAPESYLAVSPGLAVPGAGCRFSRDDVFALDVRGDQPGVTRIGASGAVSRLATVPGVATLGGIAFDTVGHFGHRLLVAGPSAPGQTQVSAIDCRGTVNVVGTVGTGLEGGMAVAPSGFGAFGGQLIAANEGNGSIYAVSSRGQLSTVAASGVAAGGDIGVEGLGFAPDRPAGAYVSDRGTPTNAAPHPGTDSLLRLSRRALSADGIHKDDLVVATEGAANGLVVRCARRCVARVVATGPAAAHVEGHVVILAQ